MFDSAVPKERPRTTRRQPSATASAAAAAVARGIGSGAVVPNPLHPAAAECRLLGVRLANSSRRDSARAMTMIRRRVALRWAVCMLAPTRRCQDGWIYSWTSPSEIFSSSRTNFRSWRSWWRQQCRRGTTAARRAQTRSWGGSASSPHTSVGRWPGYGTRGAGATPCPCPSWLC
ncbi:unnamed protein product [Ectocarpus sp. 13 AM-2016]